MKRKLRIFSNIAIIALSVCMFAFGVYAANTVSVTTSGTVSFNATDVYVEIKREVAGYDETASTNIQTTYSRTIGSETEDNHNYEDLTGEQFIFESASTPITMKFTITNKATEEGRNVYARIIDNDLTPASSNVTKSMSNSGLEETIEPGASVEITISMSVTDANFSANASYNYEISLKNTSSGVNLTDEIATFTAKNDSVGNVTEYWLDGFKDGVDTTLYPNIIVPAEYNGKPVAVIGEKAFSGNTNLTSIVMPNSINTIFFRAFDGCTNLALTSLPISINDISSAAFRNCNNLTLTSLPDGLTVIMNEAFSGCSKLALTSLPKSINEINSKAFYNCTLIKELYYDGTQSEFEAIYAIDSSYLNCKVIFSDGTSINVNYTGESLGGGA